MKLLDQYIAKLTKLNRGVTQYGKAPHKPVLLLAIIDEIEQGRITENKVYITPELVATFNDNFALLVDTPHKADFIQPFHYFAENETNPYSLKALAGKPITLPFGEIHYPKKDNLEWHLGNVFKG